MMEGLYGGRRHLGTAGIWYFLDGTDGVF